MTDYEGSDDLPADRTPRVWLLQGPKAGDYAQMRALASGLEWSAETRTLRFKPWELLLHAFPRPTRLALDRESRQALTPPWPDLVITGGRRNELVARWIRAQSGGRTRLVHIGRPWSHPDRFDLIVCTPQYPLSEFANVLMINLPLACSDEQAEPGSERLERLPSPRMVVLVGGNSGPHVFTRGLAKQMALGIGGFLERNGGSLLVSTSPRTPRRFVAALRRRLREAWQGDLEFYDWHTSRGDNPYQAYLACADGLVVTGESMSMVGEACATGKPVFLVDVAPTEGRVWWLKIKSYRWRPLIHRIANGLGPRRMRRDVRAIHARLVAAGEVKMLDEDAQLFRPVPASADDRRRAVSAVRALFDR